MLAVVKRLISSVCSIDELIENDNVARMDVLAEGATCCRGDNVSAALLPEGINVGSVVNVAWHVLMSSTMPAHTRTHTCTHTHTQEQTLILDSYCNKSMIKTWFLYSKRSNSPIKIAMQQFVKANLMLINFCSTLLVTIIFLLSIYYMGHGVHISSLTLHYDVTCNLFNAELERALCPTVMDTHINTLLGEHMAHLQSSQ